MAFILLTFKSLLLQDLPIYSILKPVKFLNLHVGDNDLTCDKDWKHVFKQWWNLLLRQRGVVVNGVQITPDIIKDQFRSTGLSTEHIRSVFNPNDTGGNHYLMLCNMSSVHMIHMFANIHDIIISKLGSARGQLAQIVLMMLNTRPTASPLPAPPAQAPDAETAPAAATGAQDMFLEPRYVFFNSSIFY